ncbi:MAG TPA: sigma-54 dependent transcriptional regulator [Candidatus Polarisedimenticolia bacterium]|nr:sigma-54 dependent transcriptional regulator [Candidatus Polarisedimenticolia bacterium]
MQRILVVEDEPDLRKVLATLLKRAGYAVDLAGSGTLGCERLRQEVYDVVITDLKLPGADGIEVLRTSKELYPDTPVIIITAYSTDEAAEEARRLGAFNYILKPFDTDKILADVGIALGWKRLGSLMSAREGRQGAERLVARSACMKEIMEVVAQVAPTGSTVLVTGESGTGKELIARAIHQNSTRAGHPFISINCGALPDELLESELFGHTRGSFTGAVATKKGFFEVADGGTIFLDEIGDTSPAMQIKLLRALQEKTIRRVGGTEEIAVDVRVITATNRDLEGLVRSKAFREDLFYRINVIPLRLPPLRERKEDIPHLAYHFFDRYKLEMGKRISSLSDDVMAALTSYDWPGNIRELQNVIERAVALEGTDVIREASLPLEIRGRRSLSSALTPGLTDEGIDLEGMLEEIRERYMREALGRRGGIQSQAARLLGMSFRSFRYFARKYNLVDRGAAVEAAAVGGAGAEDEPSGPS